MADGTHIEWTDATWNPITGCAIVSPGCTNCYAMKLAGTRLQHIPSRKGLTVDTKAGPVWNGETRLNEEWLLQPLSWRRPRRIFVCAHGDLFAESVPDAWIDRVFAVIALCPQHTFQVLTKRSGRMRAYCSDSRAATRIAGSAISLIQAGHAGEFPPRPWPLPNVWLGVSAEDQRRANERVPDLLATPAAVRFVSAEPLLGPINFTAGRFSDRVGWRDFLRGEDHVQPVHASPKGGAGLDWIIVGGESGPGARPMHPDWARQIRNDCAAAGVAFFFKQWGAWGPTHPDWPNASGRVSASDGGAQVPPAIMEGLLKLFVRASRARATTGSGFGLGSIASEIGARGGSLTATSDPEATTFSVVLPA